MGEHHENPRPGGCRRHCPRREMAIPRSAISAPAPESLLLQAPAGVGKQ